MKYPAKEILSAAREMGPVLRDLRREFHRHPELGFEEVWTTAKIKEVLSSLPGITVKPHAPKTGVVAELTGEKPELGTIGLRCDIDALPIEEKNTHDFVSIYPGKMHACGHDGHVTTVLGAAMLLSRFRPDHNVRFLFQPAEESNPGGAPGFIEAGALDGLKEVWGFHLNATSDFGKVGYYDGAVMSGNFAYDVHVTGKSGHPAYPESCINPIEIISNINMNLMSIKSAIRGTRPFIIVPCCMRSGADTGATIPGTGYLSGRCAFLDAEVGALLKEKIRTIVKNTCDSYGATAEVVITDHLPITFNMPCMGETVRKNAAEFGFEIEEIFPSMGGDDFGYYKDKVSSYYMTYGIRKGANFPIAHTPIFNFDEEVLTISSAHFASLALM